MSVFFVLIPTNTNLQVVHNRPSHVFVHGTKLVTQLRLVLQCRSITFYMNYIISITLGMDVSEERKKGAVSESWGYI